MANKVNRIEIISNINASLQDKKYEIFYGLHDKSMWVQVGMTRPDCDDHSKVELGKGGKAYLSPYATEDEIVKKVFGLCMAYAEHEVRECFYYKDARVFGPHISMEAMISIADELTEREPLTNL